MKDTGKIKELFSKFLAGSITSEESRQLFEYVDDPTNDDLLRYLIQQAIESNYEPSLKKSPPDTLFQEILTKIRKLRDNVE